MLRNKRAWLVLAVVGSLLLAALIVRTLERRGIVLTAPFGLGQPSGPRVRQPLEAGELLYDGELSRGWDDWGWGAHQLGNGPAQVKFSSYGGILFHHQDLRGPYGGLAFRYQAPAKFGEFLHVSLRGAGKPDDAFPLVRVQGRHVADVEGGFKEVLVDWRELNPDGQPFDRVLIGTFTQLEDAWVSLDKVMLTQLVASSKGDGSEALGVLCDGKTHEISELVYGAAADDWDSGQSALRMGGNPLTRFNWELPAWNVGADWFFENHLQKQSMFERLSLNRKDKRAVAVVVPMIGWVAKDGQAAGFPRAKFGPQRKHDPHRTEAGDGVRPDGSPLTPGAASETSVPAPPELIRSWVARVVEDDKREGQRAVSMYILDNEPSLWNTTHRDVRPKPLGYDELLQRTIQYASAIREADPDAVIAGPAEWGWTGYEFSAVDREAGVKLRPDRRAHEDTALVAWYLKKLAQHEQATGKRLLDVFDLHFYPAADGIYGGSAGNTDPASADLRVRSTRALWDPEYLDESWIKEKVRLIPRMKEWVRENYPGRKISLGEWSFGAEAHISGGLATAEALGRFGQQGLDAAFHWGGLNEGTPTYWAFRAFRNFDGQGARFQKVSLPVREMQHVSLFASRDESGQHLVLVLLNRQATTKQIADIQLRGCGRVTSARRFSYREGSKQLDEAPVRLEPNGVVATLDPYSISVLALDVAR
jgi:hypothetical protein